ncbi:DUF3443 domain-containing protein [Burkholderia cepacia]|uniref:DUF3443 domain-containing protein n=1 Tax=Burkholderia cepacia TaxID=292 RepID=UPI001CF5723C|nr:DUF3443 domain-containing protein [Burkholderia cepacia]MCA8318592.1 DUF3443 domain-containing protein [Burkholderia cepacia]
MSQPFKRWLGFLGLIAASAVLVSACGGGDDNSNNGGAASNGSSDAGVSLSDGNAANTAAITVDSGVSKVINIPTVNVKICVPGTSNCQIVINVLVDTASYGVRLVGNAVSGVLGNLPQTMVNGTPLAECGKFVSSYTWGSVRTVDLSIGTEQASSLPVQIIGDLSTTNAPIACVSGREPVNSASDLGANGILGIGPAPYDCGARCVTSTSAVYNNYYACQNGNANCTVALVPLAHQVANPVHRFPIDNNGVIVQMPKISDNGQANATGRLTFGIGTQSNNPLAASAMLTSTTSGDVSAAFLNRTVTAFFDTGSNAYFFNDSSQIPCSRNTEFYCPPSPVEYTATLTGQNGTTASVSMPVANANALFSTPGTFAFNNIAGAFGDAGWLDIGLPYFYDRAIYIGMDRTAIGGSGPYVAF